MKRSTLVLSLLLATLPVSARADDGERGWIQLFNGKDLAGWKVKIRGHELGENFADTFRVVDGLLSVSYDGYDSFDAQFGHIFHEREFSSYILRAEYRFVGDQARGGPGWAFRNSGLMIHGQTPESLSKDQEFPASIEVQLLGGRGDGSQRTTSNLCTPGTNVVMGGKLFLPHCTSSRSRTYDGDQWVTAIVEVRGNEIVHRIEGEEEPVLIYTDPQLDERDGDAKKLLAAGHPKMLTKGTISLQSESHPVQFRRVEILPLGDDAGTDWLEPLAVDELSKHWHTKGNWKLEDGVVSLVPREGEEGWSRFDHYLWLEGEYEDFEAEFEYRVEKGSNSGFYFHVGDESSPVAKGLEVQIYDSHGRGKDHRLNDHDSGGIIPGIPPLKNAAKAPGEWNRFRITCAGKDLLVELNGVLVNRVRLDEGRIQDRPTRGKIGFQDHALRLDLRKLRIRHLRG